MAGMFNRARENQRGPLWSMGFTLGVHGVFVLALSFTLEAGLEERESVRGRRESEL